MLLFWWLQYLLQILVCQVEANIGHTERLDMCMNTCRRLREYHSNEVAAHANLSECCQSIDQLIDCLHVIHTKRIELNWILWNVYIYNGVPITDGARVSERGRPRFEVSRDQVKYLSSLSFKWNEIVAMLVVVGWVVVGWHFTGTL